MDPNNQADTANNTAPEIDMDAINAAVDMTANETVSVQNTFDVDEITLENTPTTEAQLKEQQAANPGASLAGGIGDTPALSEIVESPMATTTPNMAGEPEIVSAPQDSLVVEKNDGNIASTASTENTNFDSPVALNEEEVATEPTSASENIAQGVKDVNEKITKDAKQLIENVKPKNNFGVIVLTAIGVVLVFAIVIGVVLFMNR